MAVSRRVALVGLGSIGQRHARLLLERPDVQLELFDPSPEALAPVLEVSPHLPVHRTCEDMLATAPDVVWIASPTRFHASQSIAALRAGADVFCEKPMSERPEDAARVRREAGISGRIFNTGFVLRFAPPLLHLRRLIASGRLGNLVHLHARVGTYVTLVNSRSHYQSATPGSLFFDYSHQPDIFYWLTGLVPSEVSALGVSAGNLPYSSDPNAAVINYRYSANLLASLHLNYVQMPQCHEYEIVGDAAWVRVSFPEGRILLGCRESNEIEELAMPLERDDLFRAQQDAFFEALDGRCPPSTPPREGEIAVAICAATLQAWQTGTPAAIRILDSPPALSA